MLNMEFGSIVKLSAIINDDDMKKSKSTNDRFLEEGFDLLVMCSKGFAFIHLMKWLITMIRNFCQPITKGNGLSVSKPHWTKG